MLVQIYGPDGVLRDTLAFSTTSNRRFFSGVLPDDSVDFQVSINNSGFSSDPAYALWGDGTWTVPNPAYDADGVNLLTGTNTIQVRSVAPNGVASPAAIATVQLVSDAVLVTAVVPTNVQVTQNNAEVAIQAETESTNGFRGMNFYASLFAGGGATGYSRVNLNLVSTGTTNQEVTSFGSLDMDADVAVDGNDVPLANPQYFRLIGRQEDENNLLLQGDLDTRYVIPETARKIRLTGDIQAVRNFTSYEFSHIRAGGPNSNPPTVSNGSFASLPADQPLFYVVTSVYYDSTNALEYESSYSQEVVGHPLVITDALGAFPSVSRQGIVQDFISSIFRSNPQIKVEPGSVLRDTVIDPFSSEAERLRFILDYLYRSRTPTLLLQIDDPSGSGASVPVSQSTYKLGLKQAFFLTSDTAVQALINGAFDTYASNFGVRRKAGISAQGEVTFFVTKRPSSTINIPLGSIVSGGSVQFSTTRAVSIDYARIASYYDPTTGRYQVTAPVRAVTSGASGNIGVGQIRQLASAVPGGVSVTNSAAMFGGSNTESNLALVTRTQNKIASVDSGTARGYLQTAADVPGVVRANVVAAGDPLMQRDIDSAGIHHGGKVDIWVQGTENIATVTDTFAFSYTISQDIQFEISGDPTLLTFRANDPSLSEENPIVEMLNDSTAGYEFRNATTGEVFDLTGVVISTYDTIILDTGIPQPSVALADVVLGSYRKRVGNTFVLPRQPVSSISSVTGTVAGVLSASEYTLVHPLSPLELGRSILSGDQLIISSGASGAMISVTNEDHVLIGQYPEYLDALGANFLSIKVYNADRSVLYRGPNDPSGLPDYEVTMGTQTVAASITRVETGAITSGSTVSIDYEHDENFTVVYTTNLIVSLTQQAVDEKKHATADVLVKEGIEVPLDISATVVFKRGQDKVKVDKALRTNFANFYAGLRLDDPVRQSDVIAIIEGTVGVSYVVVPLTKMVRQEGSTVAQELISTDTAAESVFLSSLSSAKASTYILVNPLSAATTDGGGPAGAFKGVTENDLALVLLDASASLTALSVKPGRVYIIGAEGRSIAGYSDDATLIAQGYVTSSAILARRLTLTANHVLVSLTVGTSPTANNYAVTYVVGQDSGAKDIDPGAAEYAVEGQLLFTYDEDR